MLLTIEGGEGTGKTTQLALLEHRLRAVGYAVRRTREPGGTPLAEGMRALLLHPEESLRALHGAGLTATDDQAEALLPVTEALLLSAGRAQHVQRIRGWLAAGEIVLCDRFADATRAYQGAARGLPDDLLATLERIATDGVRPDLTLLLDLPASLGQQRRWQARGDGGSWNRLDGEALAFHERVRSGYLALAAAEPARWRVVDASPAPEAVAAAIWSAVSPALPAR